MDSPCRSSVIIVGAGISGISASKVLAEKGVDDIIILEASDRIGGRIRKEQFGGVSVELGAGWIAGVGGRESNPVWELATEAGLRTCLSDYSNARYNIYDRSGKIFPSGIAADSYKRAVDSAIQKLRNQEEGHDDVTSKIMEPPSTPKTPIELAIDFILHDFEMAEVEPISTYVDFGEREFLVADERGYDCLLYKMAESFLFTSEGRILDSRLQLNKAQNFCNNCLDIKAKTDKLAALLHQTARNSNDLYERPTRRIIEDTEQVLDKTLIFVDKCRANTFIKHLFTIIPTTTLKKISMQLENSIGDVQWLLRVSASGDERDDEYLGLPPIASNEPILCLIWEQIANLLSNGSGEERFDAAAFLVSLARDNDRYGKLILEEGGVPPLLNLKERRFMSFRKIK